jgi:formate dehydrogenase major subunit
MDRSSDDLRALTTLMLLLGKISVTGSGIALLSSQCNQIGSQLAGFDHRLLPGGNLVANTHARKEIAKHWKLDVVDLLEKSGTNISRKIREDKIRAAIILGENPSIASQYHNFITNLEFLVVADMFMTETAQSADVFIPLSGYLETEGHLTNWCGKQQRANPIGTPLSGKDTIDIIKALAKIAGSEFHYAKFSDITDELGLLIQTSGIQGRFNGSFLTEDGKAHFVLYGDQVTTTPPMYPRVLSIDERMMARSKSLKK